MGATGVTRASPRSPGIGGGLYNLGSLSEVATLIAHKHASTSHDNIFP
jgi:hypothetical protein